MVTIADEGLGGLPQGLSLQGLEKVISCSALQVGEPVLFENHRLRFPSRGLVLRVEVTGIWTPRWEGRSLRPTASIRARDVARVAANWVPSEGFGPIIRRWEAIAALREPDSCLGPVAKRGWLALVSYLRCRRPDPLLGLIGVGPGLTPSGDDLLRGYLGFRAICGPLPAWKVEALRQAKLNTNALSFQLLWHATHSRLSEDLGNLIVALATGSHWFPHFRRILKEGHTSGADLLLGVLLALWERDHQRL